MSTNTNDQEAVWSYWRRPPYNEPCLDELKKFKQFDCLYLSDRRGAICEARSFDSWCELSGAAMNNLRNDSSYHYIEKTENESLGRPFGGAHFTRNSNTQ